MIAHLLRHEYLSRNMQIDLLHIGPDRGLAKWLKRQPNVQYTSVDKNEHRAEHVQDLAELTFEAAQFDLIICSHVLGFIERDDLALHELNRVTRKGGTCLIINLMDPASSSDTNYDQADASGKMQFKYRGMILQRIYGTNVFERIRNAGFKVIKRTYAREMDDHTVRTHGMAEGDHDLILECIKTVSI